MLDIFNYLSRASFIEHALGCYLLPSTKSGTKVNLVSAKFDTLFFLKKDKHGVWYLSRQVPLSGAELLELSSQLLLRVIWLDSARIAATSEKERESIINRFVDRLVLWAEQIFPHDVAFTPLLLKDRKAVYGLYRSARKRFARWEQIHPNQLSQHCIPTPVGADLKSLMTSPGHVWNAFQLSRYASGHQLPTELVAALIRPGPAVDAANWFSQEVPAAFPQPFVVYVGGYVGRLARLSEKQAVLFPFITGPVLAAATQLQPVPEEEEEEREEEEEEVEPMEQTVVVVPQSVPQEEEETIVTPLQPVLEEEAAREVVPAPVQEGAVQCVNLGVAQQLNLEDPTGEAMEVEIQGAVDLPNEAVSYFSFSSFFLFLLSFLFFYVSKAMLCSKDILFFFFSVSSAWLFSSPTSASGRREIISLVSCAADGNGG